MTYDCIVVGAGPAGVTAAIQLKRSGCSVLLFEKQDVGGLLRNARKVENFPGFPGGISGAEFVRRLEAQLRYFNIEMRQAEVREILREDHQSIVRTNDGMFRARNIIVATGTRPKKAGIPGEEKLVGERVFYEVADLPLASSEKRVINTVIVIGGGDCGFDYALNLHDRGRRPVIVTRSTVQCLPLLRKEAEARGIPYYENIIPEEIREEGSGVRLLAVRRGAPLGRPATENVCTNIPSFNVCHGRPNGAPLRTSLRMSLSADLILIAVGREPCLPPLPESAGGLSVVGDACGGRYRQACIAAGDALQTVMEMIGRHRGSRCISDGYRLGNDITL